jgi:type II restriction enzyme
MSHKGELRRQRENTIINARSKRQERDLTRALNEVSAKLKEKFPGVQLHHVREWKLKDVVERLRQHFPDVDFHYSFNSSAMRPDGGILSLLDKTGKHLPILILEKKNQGTNDLRRLEGKEKQPKGNAIERLGKNVIGFRAALKGESIFPFVCFGDGCDFSDDSSILDRVVTIAQFGRLNVEHLHKQGANNEFDRGTFYFRAPEWTENEMAELSLKVAEKSVYYYFSKYGEESFR